VGATVCCTQFYPEKGFFACAGCEQPLYTAASKFDSGCGWPVGALALWWKHSGTYALLSAAMHTWRMQAFDKCFKDSIVTEVDESGGMRRVEIMCGGCGGHLGHVFENEKGAGTERHCGARLPLMCWGLHRATASLKGPHTPTRLQGSPPGSRASIRHFLRGGKCCTHPRRLLLCESPTTSLNQPVPCVGDGRAILCTQSFARVESSRASSPHMPREDGLTHSADTSRSNLAAACSAFQTISWFRFRFPAESSLSSPHRCRAESLRS
jgi:peptide methionine sulfoxide reductase MsrB